MLTKKQLINLRKNICLNSLFLKDYENDLYIKNKTVCDFFDSYIENLYDIAKNENFKSDDIIDIIDKYDNAENLYNYYIDSCVDGYDPLIKNDYIAYHNESLFAGCVIYDVRYGVYDYILCASYYINKYGYMIINKLTKNKIYYDSIGDVYIKKYNHRYYLNNFIKTNF